MKRTFLFFVAALSLLSCSGVSEKTTIAGKFTENAPSEVRVAVAAIGVDTTVQVTDNIFLVRIPACRTEFGVIEYEKEGKPSKVSFISDGTSLLADFTEETPRVISANPRKSIQKDYAEMQEWEEDFSEEYRKLETEEEKEEAVKLYSDYYTRKALDNADNAVAARALMMIDGLATDEEMSAIVEALSPEMKENTRVKYISDALEARLNTKEGADFIDFECNGQKLSDYVGKGKVILVDFWASWCGPCKGEVPFIKDVYEKYAGNDFDVLGIAVWDDVEDTKAAIEKLGIKWNQMLGTDKIATDAYGISGIPQIILFGADGKILKKDLRGEAIESAVKEALGR